MCIVLSNHAVEFLVLRSLEVKFKSSFFVLVLAGCLYLSIAVTKAVAKTHVRHNSSKLNDSKIGGESLSVYKR